MLFAPFMFSEIELINLQKNISHVKIFKSKFNKFPIFLRIPSQEGLTPESNIFSHAMESVMAIQCLKMIVRYCKSH